MASQTFNDILQEAINDFAERGYVDQAQLDHWLRRLADAIDITLTPDDVMERMLRDAFQEMFDKLVQQGRILQYHPSVERFTLERLKPSLHGALNQRILASANLIKLNREQMIAKTLQRFSGWATAVPKGGSDAVKKREEKEKVRKGIAGIPFEERRVLIDQGHKLNAALSDIIAKDSGAIAGKWFSHWRQPGYDYREDHKERDGVVFVVRDNWAMQRGLMKLAGAQYIDEITQPGEEPFCFPGDLRVPFADGVEVGYRRWYSGQLTEIVTASGKTLRATPNHPVLTTKGWFAIDRLQVGDDVIEVADQVRHLSKDHQNDTEPTLAEIFATLLKGGTFEVCRGHFQQFHGDGAAGDVDIVYAAWPLTFGRHSLTTKFAGQFKFTVPNIATFGAGALNLLLSTAVTSSARIMGGFGQALSPNLSFAAHAYGVGGGPTANRNSHLLETVCQEYARRTRVPRQPQEALAGSILASKVIDIDRGRWSGHVFNLQTRDNWFVTEGIVTHNCRCLYRWLYHLRDLPDRFLTAKGRAALLNVKVVA